MATITLINWTDNIKDSRSVINNNFTNLNNDKVEKITWKGLSTEDYTTTEKNKLAWIEAWAEVNTLNDVIAWTNITIDKTDPLNPVINSTASWWATDFTDLWDVPSSYTWQTLKVVRVNAWETALEFATISGGWDMLKSENLSWLSNYTTARSNLWLDTTANQTDYVNKRFMSDAQEIKLDWISWTNTWDNATNTQYSWLATSKQDTLVSWTNIKTVNWTSLLWSWNIVISGGSWAIRKLFAIAWSIWTTWTNVANTIVVDWTYTISQVNMWYWTAWAGATDLIVDINLNWTSICSTTKPKITWTNQSSINTWNITTTTCASWNIFTLDLDQIQSVPWTDLYVEIIYS